MSLSDVSMQILHFLNVFFTFYLRTFYFSMQFPSYISLLKTPLYSAKILKAGKERKWR